MKKAFLSGNEAIARGAWEAGVKLAAAYPGTPSTEILESIAHYKEIYSEWSPNEKVALEVALGAAIAGKRSIAAMKHVGLNVAADPFFSAAYTGVAGGFVVVSADDPGMHSSQNEQDNRNYAYFAKVPMLEPSDSQEAKDFTKIAFEISEKYDTPVLLRITTRISHSKGLVELEERKEVQSEFPQKNEKKYVTIPAHARRKRVQIEQRTADLLKYSEETELNRVEDGTGDTAFITSSISYTYVKENYPDAAILKLGFTNPLPMAKIRDFVNKYQKVIIVEELDPYMEILIKAEGIKIEGKKYIPAMGELNATIVKNSIENIKDNKEKMDIPVRPPALCPGCPHRGVFTILRELGVRLVGDIGCYTLGVLPPLSALDWQICMGGGVSMVQGIEKAWDDKIQVAGMVGDSTFFHSGITGLIDIFYNKGIGTIFVVDNSTTAMTGVQDHPGTGRTLMGEDTKQVSIKRICEAIGIEDVFEIDPFDLDLLYDTAKKSMSSTKPAVIITKRPCILLRFKAKERFEPIEIDTELCIGCKSCISIACPALFYDNVNRKSGVHPHLCIGCEICAKMCPKDAFKKNGQPLKFSKKHKIREKQQ